jgi:hypothetical protein
LKTQTKSLKKNEIIYRDIRAQTTSTQKTHQPTYNEVAYHTSQPVYSALNHKYGKRITEHSSVVEEIYVKPSQPSKLEIYQDSLSSNKLKLSHKNSLLAELEYYHKLGEDVVRIDVSDMAFLPKDSISVYLSELYKQQSSSMKLFFTKPDIAANSYNTFAENMRMNRIFGLCIIDKIAWIFYFPLPGDNLFKVSCDTNIIKRIIKSVLTTLVAGKKMYGINAEERHMVNVALEKLSSCVIDAPAGNLRQFLKRGKWEHFRFFYELNETPKKQSEITLAEALLLVGKY